MNENLDRVKISGIRKFYNEVQKVEGAISLTLGQPDFNIPTSIEEGLVNAIQENKTTYTSNAGIVELREEISKYLLTKDIAYEADELCITVGGSEALFNIFTALLNKDDKVLIPTPAYPAYESIVTILGGTVVNYSLDNEFKIDVKDIKNKIKDMNIKDKLIILHIGSSVFGKKASLTRFINNFKKLPIHLQEIIAIENDDKVFVIEDVLEICEKINIPCVLDYHHYICNHDKELKSLLPRIFATWKDKIPKMHYSSPKSKLKKEFRSHHDYINSNDFIEFLDFVKEFNTDIDIMLEAKAKDEALFRLVRELKYKTNYTFLDETTFEI